MNFFKKIREEVKSCSCFPMFAASSFATPVIIIDPMPFASLLKFDTISLAFYFDDSPVWVVSSDWAKT